MCNQKQKWQTEFLKTALLLVVVFGSLFLLQNPAQAQSQTTDNNTTVFPLRTHQPVYQNPFDLASGGASLTRATQEGAFFLNPSLPAYGYNLHRWAFFRTQLHLDNATSQSAAEAYANQTSENPITPELIQNALQSPVHVGHDTALGYVTSYFSLVGFSNVRADIAVRRYGDAGAPQVRARAYGVGGGGISTSYALAQFISLGVASKYVEVVQAADNISIEDVQNPDGLSQKLTSLLKRGKGVSTDAALTLQLRSKHLDLRVAGSVHDIGNTDLGADLEPYRQTVGAGVGLTIHGRDNSFHCAADLRDVLAAYEEHWTFRAYSGCKLTFYRSVSFGAGVSQGYPTGGVVLNLGFTRLEAGTYTREVGTQVGVEGRTVYFFALGVEY